MNRLFAVLVFALASANASAVILSLAPSTQDAGVGDTVLVELVASDLPFDGIGAFDIDVTYDAAALSFSSYILSDNLGDSIDVSFGDDSVGTVNIGEVSFESGVALAGIQVPPGPIVLATLAFIVDVLAPGDSTLLGFGFTNIISGLVSDVPVDGTAGAVITNPRVTVPEPGTLGLLGAGLIGLAWRRRKA